MSDNQLKSFILFVANIPINTTQRQLYQVFRQYGQIQSIHLSANSKRIQTTFAFVQFDDMRDAYDAIQELNNTKFKDKVLRIEYRIGSASELKRFENDEDVQYVSDRKDKQQIIDGRAEIQSSNSSNSLQQSKKSSDSQQDDKYHKMQDKLIQMQKKIFYLEQRVLRLQGKQ